MVRSCRPGVLAIPIKSLPACLSALLAINAIAGSKGTNLIASTDPNSVIRAVANCDDAGPGSLRDTINIAGSGDVIDLTQLTCSSITLGGKIPIVVNDLTLLGPGTGPDASHHVTIHGAHGYRIFEHGVGTLIIAGLEVADGHYIGPLARGGCIFSSGTLVIEDSIVTGCEVEAPFGSNVFAAGGAIYHQGYLWMKNSTITHNTAYSAMNVAYGGGVFAGGAVTIDESTIAGNKATAPQAYAKGGGLMIAGVGDVNISSSTISGNEAEVAGGMHVDTLGTSRIINSTLSGNYASMYVGAAFFVHGPVAFKNSTVTRNSAFAYTAGIFSDQTITAQSSILADNRTATNYLVYDVYAPSVVGAANVITSANGATPPDTIVECPRLTALGDHGGPTMTHALLPGGPGIDTGNNTVPLVADQRGARHARVVGIKADIGAYEWQGELDDEMFKSAFETACDVY